MITASTLCAEVHARAPVESLVPTLVYRVMGAHMLHSVCTSLAQCFTAQGSISLRTVVYSEEYLVHSIVEIMKRMSVQELGNI